MTAGAANVAFIVPLWRRTANIHRLYMSVIATVPRASVLFVVSAGDQDVINALVNDGFLLDACLILDGDGGGPGDYAKKINAGYRETTEPYIFTGADDLIPQPGWFEACLAHMTPEIGVVGTVDNTNPRTMRGEHSTHSLVARWYADQGACVDQDHVIYHEGYQHEFCDDELVRTAMSRGAYAHAFSAVVDHDHWTRNRTLMDDVYRHGKAKSAVSRRLFYARRHLWGDRPASIRQVRRVAR